MVRPVRRRQASVAKTKQLLAAIGYIRQQKQIPNLERIFKYMQREHSMGHGECRRNLEHVVNDGFIVEYKAVGSKGSRTGLEQEGYKIPTDDELDPRDDHDWYCFTCHNPGDVLLCSECFRVYHVHCTVEDYSGSKFTCSVCKEVEAGKRKNKMKKKMLNTLLSYTILRLREKTKELYKIGTKADEEDIQRFVYQRVDLNTMEIKVQASKYRCLEEFSADAQNILHNCILIYGHTADMTQLADVMLKDCKYDLDEIQLCSNCYYMSNAKPEQWFCQPCNPPHDLVYAKMKGFGYWPAKVIKELEDGKMDVRFFGGWHQRAVIPAEYIRPVTTGLKSLTIKRTVGFTKACKELKTHQKFLEEREQEMEEQDIDLKQQVFEEEEEEPAEASSQWEEDNIQVTSTSVDTKRKRKSSSVKAALPDEVFVVTSSEDKVTQPQATKTKAAVKAPMTANIHIQTLKVKTHVVGTQTVKSDTQDDKDGEEEEDQPVEKKRRLVPQDKVDETQVQARIDKALSDKAEILRKQYEEEKNKALKELTERLKKDFEEDKQAAVGRAMGNMSREVDKARKIAEEKSKEQYMEEMKKLAAKHKEAISQTKKKQWCFNCEEEAMYHCCWNTSYCSVRCQQEHWHKEHKRVCRRKR